MKTAKLITQTWLTTAGAVASALGTATYNTTILLALALNEPKPPRKPRKPEAPYEGTWAERMFGRGDVRG